MKLQYLLYMTAALSLTSCNDAFLDRESQSINDGTFWNSVNDLRTYANAFYGILPGGVTNLGDEDSDNQVPFSPTLSCGDNTQFRLKEEAGQRATGRTSVT